MHAGMLAKMAAGSTVAVAEDVVAEDVVVDNAQGRGRRRQSGKQRLTPWYKMAIRAAAGSVAHEEVDVAGQRMTVCWTERARVRGDDRQHTARGGRRGRQHDARGNG